MGCLALPLFSKLADLFSLALTSLSFLSLFSSFASPSPHRSRLPFTPSPTTLRAALLESLRNMPFAPSAQMQHVPYDFEDDEEDEDEDLDVRISGELGI